MRKWTTRSFRLWGAVTLIAIASVGYIPNMLKMREKVELVALADVLPERARSVAARFGVPQDYGSVEEMIEKAGVEAVVNLTPIPAHAATSRTILSAGKHCVSEKPIATTLAEADDRILCTSVDARWRHGGDQSDWEASYAGVRDALRAMLAAFFVVGYIAASAALSAAGVLGRQELALGLVLVPGAAIGLLLGPILAGRLNRSRLRTAVLTISAVSAVVLLFR